MKRDQPLPFLPPGRTGRKNRKRNKGPSRPRRRLRKEGISLHGFEIGLLKILYFGNPTLLDKSIMERMIGVCSKVFWAFEMHRQTKAMGISKAERKSVSPGKPVEYLRRKVTVCSIQKKNYGCLVSGGFLIRPHEWCDQCVL